MQALSKYYRFGFCDNLEALSASNYKTSFPSHFHSTFNLSLVYDGTFNTQLNDRLVMTPSGSLLITSPEEIHANPFDKNAFVSFFTFYISKGFMEYCNKNAPVFFFQKTINNPFLFISLHNLSLKLRENSDANIEERLIEALQLLIAGNAAIIEETPPKTQVLFQRFLAEQDIVKFSLEGAARQFGMDKFKFIRLFKFQTGLTPANYFMYRRIEKSKSMLAEGRDLLSIAIELGFYDAAHYGNHFKKFTGISPLAFLSAK